MSLPAAPLADAMDRLRLALRHEGGPWRDAALEPLRDKGLAHDHIRLAGTGALARLPKQSQLGLGARANLIYQAACFERAAAGGHTPRLLGVLPVSEALPHGGLLVEEIVGRAARLPQDLDALVRALVALHALPLPARRAPLLDATDPLADLLGEIAEQASYLDAAHIGAPVRVAIETGLAQLHSLCAQPTRPARCLVSFDAHPGNFIIRADGTAILVDLEKCRYSYPGLDLAHATLYTSTTWDVDTFAILSNDQVLSAYARWDQSMGTAAQAARAWHLPLRRAMWLWSITWCAKWRVVSGAHAKASADGEDWSAEHSDAALVAHVRERVDHYLSAPVMAQVLDGFDALREAFKA